MSYYRDFRVTKREVLFSVVIICIMMLIGLVIHGNINDNLMMKYQEYNTALQIEDDADMFTYGMRTNIGNAFVHGDLKAVDTVTYPEIGGEYSYVEKVKERYTRHTRTVNVYEEEYWTWDKVDSCDKHCEKISFLDVEFDYGMINFPSPDYITTQKESSKIRYKYYGTGTEYIGTLYTNLADNTISKTSFYNNQSINETIEYLESGGELILFWFLWIVLTSGCVIGFCYLDNKWLEDKKQNYYKRKYY